jgi:EAL and modified HD-GYP domain-containing signal transduction protein
MDDMNNIIGYDLMSQHVGQSKSASSEHDDSVLSGIINAFIQITINNLFGEKSVFVNANADFLMSENPLMFPKNKLVFKLGKKNNLKIDLFNRIQVLKSSGYSVALDDFSTNDPRCSLLNYADFVLIDINNLNVTSVYSEAILGCAKCIAKNVDSQELLSKAKEIGFKSYQGSYFAESSNNVKIISPVQDQAKMDSKIAILDLILKLKNEDYDKNIEDFFKAHPLLTIEMLRLLKFESSGNVSEINSVHQALLLLGRDRLAQRFMSLLYGLENSKSDSGPLMIAAMWRAKFMELMVIHTKITRCTNLEDQAYMVGMFSMLPAILNDDLNQIISGLNLSSEISKSLIFRLGELGGLLKIAEALQFKPLNTIEDLALDQNYNIDTLMHVQNKAFLWVQRYLAGSITKKQEEDLELRMCWQVFS